MTMQPSIQNEIQLSWFNFSDKTRYVVGALMTETYKLFGKEEKDVDSGVIQSIALSLVLILGIILLFAGRKAVKFSIAFIGVLAGALFPILCAVYVTKKTISRYFLSRSTLLFLLHVFAFCLCIKIIFLVDFFVCCLFFLVFV